MIDIEKFRGWLVWQRLNAERGHDASKLEELETAMRYVAQFIKEQQSQSRPDTLKMNTLIG